MHEVLKWCRRSTEGLQDLNLNQCLVVASHNREKERQAVTVTLLYQKLKEMIFSQEHMNHSKPNKQVFLQTIEMLIEQWKNRRKKKQLIWHQIHNSSWETESSRKHQQNLYNSKDKTLQSGVDFHNWCNRSRSIFPNSMSVMLMSMFWGCCNLQT